MTQSFDNNDIINDQIEPLLFVLYYLILNLFYLYISKLSFVFNLSVAIHYARNYVYLFLFFSPTFIVVFAFLNITSIKRQLFVLSYIFFRYSMCNVLIFSPFLSTFFYPFVTCVYFNGYIFLIKLLFLHFFLYI